MPLSQSLSNNPHQIKTNRSIDNYLFTIYSNIIILSIMPECCNIYHNSKELISWFKISNFF
jgi:hypothetical protein